MNSRRDFIRKTATGTAAVAVGGVLPGFSARSYHRIAGSNNMVRISVMGVNSRGRALAENNEGIDILKSMRIGIIGYG